jgi:hypothetical protein
MHKDWEMSMDLELGFCRGIELHCNTIYCHSKTDKWLLAECQVLYKYLQFYVPHALDK